MQTDNYGLPGFNEIKWLISEKEVVQLNDKLLLPLEPNRIPFLESDIWKTFKVKEYRDMLFFNRKSDVDFVFMNDQLISYRMNIYQIDSSDVSKCDSDCVSYFRQKYGSPEILHSPPDTYYHWNASDTYVDYISIKSYSYIDQSSSRPKLHSIPLFSAEVIMTYKPIGDTLSAFSFFYYRRSIECKQQPNQALKLTE